MANHFPKICGQHALKRKLSFGLDAFFAGEILPSYLFSGAKGGGKNAMAIALAKAIHGWDKEYRCFEINCAKFSKAADFFNSEDFLNKILGKPCVIYLDEAHNLPKDMMNIFLTLFSTDGGEERVIPYNDLVINLRKQIFLFGTSEPDKLFAPLKDRLKTAVLAPCKAEEIQEIVAQRFPEIKYEEGLLSEIASHTRGTPRSAVEMAKDIRSYCTIKKIIHFSAKDWKKFCTINDAKIHGLDNVELDILKTLVERGPCSLNELRAITGLSRTALINNHEIKLLQNNLMRVDGKRQVTNFGRKIVDKFKLI